jgi:hypothetical protein
MLSTLSVMPGLLCIQQRRVCDADESLAIKLDRTGPRLKAGKEQWETYFSSN